MKSALYLGFGIALAVCGGMPVGGAEPAGPVLPASPDGRVVQEGIAIDLAVEPLVAGEPLREGQSARFRLSLSDTNTGTPLTNNFPAAWLDARQAAGGPQKAAGCREKVQSFLGGGLLTRPELDLNVYYVITLNDNATLSVVDPLFGFGNSKLLTMVFLEGRGEDWVLTPDGKRLFVALPDPGLVAVVDTDTWKVLANLPAGQRPHRIALQADGQYVWVAGEGAVTVIDARAAQVVRTLPAGKGRHDLVLSHDSRWAFLTDDAAGTVAVYDTGALARVREVAVGPRPVSIDWSVAAGAAWASLAGDGALVALRPDAAEPVARAQAEPGLGRLRFAPGGRLGFVVHPEKNLVHLLDAASGRIIQTADVGEGPDQVTFSEELAYIRHQGTDQVLMIPLKTVGEEGRPVPLVDFPGGQHPPGRSTGGVPADGIVSAAGEAAVLVANPEDKAIYFYKEGMAAPMGHFQNYGRQPRAVLVVDRTLREIRPGVYETVARLTGAGDYELAVFLDAPRIVHCFPVHVEEDPVLARERSKKPLGVELRTENREVKVGEEVAVRFRLTDPDSGAAKTGLKDVRVLTFLSPGVWQQRHWAVEQADGVYEIRFHPPEEGLYFVFLEVPSAGLALQKAPFFTFTAR